MKAITRLCPRAPSTRCVDARLSQPWQFQRRGFYRSTPLLVQKQNTKKTKTANVSQKQTSAPRAPPSPSKPPPAPASASTPPPPPSPAVEPRPDRPVTSEVRVAQAAISELIVAERILEEKEVLAALALCKLDPTRSLNTSSPTSAILSLDSSDSQGSRSTPAPQETINEQAKSQLAQLAFQLMTHPPVFITPDILHTYCTTMAALQRPQTLPTVLHLYAHKPVPVPGSHPPQYKAPKPNALASAVKQYTADTALEAAIESKDLNAALGVINESVRTQAFRHNRFFRKASAPIMLTLMTPFGVWQLARWIAAHQVGTEEWQMTKLTFAGCMAYLGGTGIIGFVALTTWNDHMERVTWEDGTPLSTRWMREPERAALDKVAMGWGFTETWRRGDEEGEDWEGLREWIGLRGMILDRVTLMDGMQ